MSTFVILSLALAVVILGAVVVAARHLLKTVRRLSAAVRAVREQVTPLTVELSAELAVTGTEIAALGDAVGRVQTERAQRRRRREGIKLRRKPAKRPGLLRRP